jgi:ATP-dependent Clp protease protease subunit
MAEIISHHSHRPLSDVERDIDRDNFMSAEQARDYGLVDEIIQPRRGLSAPLTGATELEAAVGA